MSIANPDTSDLTLDDCPLCHSSISNTANGYSYWYVCTQCDLAIHTRYINERSIHRTVGKYVVWWYFSNHTCEITGASVRDMRRIDLRVPWQPLDITEQDVARYVVLL